MNFIEILGARKTRVANTVHEWYTAYGYLPYGIRIAGLTLTDRQTDTHTDTHTRRPSIYATALALRRAGKNVTL